MKKVTRILIIVSTLLLFSCDVILNVMYPSYDPNNSNTFGSNTIHVDLSVDWEISQGETISVALVPMYQENGLWEPDTDNVWIWDFWNTDYIEFDFNQLPNAIFRVFAFVDVDANGLPGFDEPSIALFQDYGVERFDFTTSTGAMELTAQGHLGNYPGIDFFWLEKFNKDSQEAVNRNFFIEGPMFLNKFSLGNDYMYRVKFDDPGLIINSIEWEVYDLALNPITFYSTTANGGKEVHIDFSDFSDVDLARDNYEEIILKAFVTYEGGIVVFRELFIEITEDDPSFTIDGSHIIYPSGSETYYVNTASKTLDGFDWRIKNVLGDDMFYDGSFEFNYEPFGNTFTIYYDYIDLGGYPWDQIHLEVIAYYEDGSQWHVMRPIDLGE